MTEDHIPEVLTKVREFLEKGDVRSAISTLEELHPADQAEAFSDLGESDQKEIFPELDSEAAASILEEMPEHDAMELAAELPTEELASVLDEMTPAGAADILGDLPPEQASSALAQMEDSSEVAPLLKFPDDTAGGRMSPDVVTLKASMTSHAAIDFLRQRGPDSTTPYYLYVVDENQVLRGVTGLRDLIVAGPNDFVSTRMETEVIRVNANADQEEAANLIAKYKLLMLPVVDDGGKLLGVIRSTDILDVVQEEATEDVYSMAGLSDGELTVWSPLKQTVRKRLPWLLVNLLTAFLAAAVVSHYEATIAQFAVLAVLQGIIAGQGGNSGTQTLAIMVRGIALGEVALRDSWRALTKEIHTALLHGIIIGVAVGLCTWWWMNLPLLGVIACVAMIGNIFAAAVAGTIIPLLLKACRLDPAIASGVMVTMVTDCVGFGLFLGLATFFLQSLR